MAKGSKMSGSTRSKRESTSGEFVVGRKSFASISAVEGIHMSRDMHGEFRRTDDVSADKRRSMLSDKYGKKKR